MQRSRQQKHRLLRWLLAGWLVILPWLTQAMPLEMSPVDVPVGVEMPCHGDMVTEAAQSAAPECPHCTGDSLAACKCCSFATGAAVPNSEAGTHLLIGSSETFLSDSVIRPPSGRHERLYRPPIRHLI